MKPEFDNIEALIFDMDGTLLDSLTDLQNTLNYCFRKEGFPERTYQEVHTFVGNGLRTLIERAVPQGTADKKIDERRLVKEDIIQKIEADFKKEKPEINGNLIIIKPKQDGDERHRIRNLRLLADKVRDLQISGVKKIGKVIIRKDEEWVIHTEGSNLKEILSFDGIDARRTTTNSIREIEDVLGIEAARQSIINEANNTLSEQGLTVDVRHIMLVADIMTSEGEVKSIGRHGISGEKSSVLARAAFEETGKHLLNASIRGEVDDLTGIIENIIIGQPIPLGTGSVGVKMDYKNV